MIFRETPLRGAFVIDLEPQVDPRGFFARTWCENEATAHGLNPRVAQCSVSFNARRGTLRGMHYQAAPHEEAKVVSCTRGALFDVIIDLRRGSPTFARHVDVVLTAENRRRVYVPEGFAHGFQTLEDDTEVCYQISERYHPELARGVAWDDPAFGINWPIAEPSLSEQDSCRPWLDGQRSGGRDPQ